MVLSTEAKVKEELMDIPNDYECPITHELMEDPVIAADGFSYEKSSIEEWFRRGHRTSPKTGAELLHTNLTPNQTLKNVIIEFKQRLPYIQREQQTKTDLDIAIRLREEDIESFFQKLKKPDLLQTKKKVIQQVKHESIEYAEKQGIIGPRSLVGFELKDVDDKGNCFYESIADQLELINHEFISQTPSGTKAHDRLRLAIQGKDFQDLEWADDKTFDEFVRKFSDVILAIIDTRNPQAGFVCYYYEDDNIITNTGELEISLPNSRPILRIASTGNHFLSIIGHPYMERGAVKDPFNAIKMFEKHLSEQLAKLKISDSTKLVEKIQKMQKRLLEDSDEESIQKETKKLKELEYAQLLAQKIDILRSEGKTTTNNEPANLEELEKSLSEQLGKLKISEAKKLQVKIRRLKSRIEEGSDEEENIQKLEELEKVQFLIDKIEVLRLEKKDLIVNTQSNTYDVTSVDANKKRIELKLLREDFDLMPDGVEKTLTGLIIHFEKSIIEDYDPSEIRIDEVMKNLDDQIKQQDLLSEDIKEGLQKLKLSLQSNDSISIIGNLRDILKKIRPINVQEICRLVMKTKEAADLIDSQEIILLVGETGVGKSTTIQFLAGAKMQEKQVEIAPGKFLEHIEPIEYDNPSLREVISSPFGKSETRYIKPIVIPLKDIYGGSKSGSINLCDSPGFEDTSGPEVDIANSIGVIAALQNCKSVKILALSSYKSLGDRGQGIQKLAHTLVNMIRDIEDRLNTVVYAFTKYPPNKDVNAMLMDIKNSAIEQDPSLKTDTAFLAVLNDMIEKTEERAYKIDPILGDPKKLIDKLIRTKSILYPGEVFQFSISSKTQSVIQNQIQKYQLSIICNVKNKNYELVKYYLDNLKILQHMLNQNSIKDAYEESVRFIVEDINDYYKDIVAKFNRAIVSQDGLQDEDINIYKYAIEQFKNMQILKVHLVENLIDPSALIQNIASQLKSIFDVQKEENLHSVLVVVYLNNLYLIKESFTEFSQQYIQDCNFFEERFGLLNQSLQEYLLSNDFQKVAEILFIISNCIISLMKHFDEKFKESYLNCIKMILQYLDSFNEKADPILDKVRLTDKDINLLKSYLDILRTAKDNSLLQEKIYVYLESIKNNNSLQDRSSSPVLEESYRDLNEIYNEFILKLVKYFSGINQRIKELFDKSGDHALEDIENLVKDMESMRTIPEIESKTASIYYRTVENVRGYMQHLQKEAEQLLVSLDQQSGIINYGRLARALARLKNAEWINRVSPGAYDMLMRQITEELVQHVQKLESNFMRLDLSLKQPDNVLEAQKIFEQIESMSALERSVPDLKKYRESISQRFIQSTQSAFDHIQRTFNLQDRAVYQVKRELKDLEQIRREYEDLHPAKVYLSKQDYHSIEILDKDISELTKKTELQTKSTEHEKFVLESEDSRLNSIVLTYLNLITHKQTQEETSLLNVASKIAKSAFRKDNIEANNYLKLQGYPNIEAVYEAISTNKKKIKEKEHLIQTMQQEISHALSQLQSIKTEYDSLRTRSATVVTQEEMSFLQKLGHETIESLDEAIQKKKKIIEEREKNKQQYNFNERLDASTASNALAYTNNCEKTNYISVKEVAINTTSILQDYIKKYGDFIYQEIESKFIYSTNIDVEDDYYKYGYSLEMRLQELSILSKYKDIFEYLNGPEKLDNLQRKFVDYFHTLRNKMEEYREQGNHRELKNQLKIAQALSCLDRFCREYNMGVDFGELHRKFRLEVNKEAKTAYKLVLDYISSGNYASADMALSEIEDSPMNPRDIAQIKHDLQSSLDRLMKDTKSRAYWLDGKIEREDNREKIMEINANIEKIRIALNKNAIIAQLEGTATKENLLKFNQEIDDILSRIILKGLESIEAFMDANSFSEAEQGMENLSRVQQELSSCCYSQKVLDKSEELRKRLHDIVTDILEKNTFQDISEYPINPPKDLLSKLKIVASRGTARYMQAYTSMLGKIRQNFSKNINDVREAPLEHRHEKIRILNYALCFLTEELQAEFKLQIDELTKFIADQEKAYKSDLEGCIANDTEEAIRKTGLLADKYKKENMQELFAILKEKILEKIHAYKFKIEELLERQEIQAAIEITKKISKYVDQLYIYIEEIKPIYHSVCALMTKSFLKYSDAISNIGMTLQTSVVEKSFDNLLIFSRYPELFNEDILMQDVPSIVLLPDKGDGFVKIASYFVEHFEIYERSKKDKNIFELSKAVITFYKWDTLLQKIKQSLNKQTFINICLQKISDVPSIKDMITYVEELVSYIKEETNLELINEETIKFEDKRESFFKNIAKCLTILRDIKNKLGDILQSSIDVKKLEEEIFISLSKKIEKIGDDLIVYSTKLEDSSREADQIRVHYYHLQASEKHLALLLGVDIQKFLREFKEKILKKITDLRKEVTKESSPITTAELLIKMKFFAENLSMLESDINQDIDECLKSYKDKVGVTGSLMPLCMNLEKTDIGCRLMQEHSCLKGEDWRTRREKMQKQDNIDYVLSNLEGDNISKDLLRTRYHAFKKTYDNLLSEVLGSFDQRKSKEPDLGILITKTKLLVVKANCNSNKILWEKSFVDQIPELLAHVFAIWTLKNTEHYNAARGIEVGKAYLLMPHAAQVVAILRILGIGYETQITQKGVIWDSTKTVYSKDLINNLVEIGTGEGKSVVMAVTACIFALVGLEVSCSCYSEYLSNRDKKDFASLFITLGVDKYIEYGTFNKLCENLLNEQCNVRETVKDMIINNRNDISTVNKKQGIHKKVLLIDEVDVFLSDKFYGGMYNPSVYLNEPTIKVLLDTLWNKRSSRLNLSMIKLLPSYQACANKYSNWTFLLEEALKDMIAALQSYRSSTYIVSNDRIVYIEGESVVDNVVRGYDTIWAYYHEHDQGRISKSSLESNVGIILNCGTFSYAEMPHDFIYITGVTGTLKTLAKPEKEILQSVYGIDKSTFMPSVFGENNRNYNSRNDVQAIKEAEYFMNIRNDIDVMRRAKRAILVFFESEDKLLAFYNSIELQDIKHEVQVITERVSVKERELFIKRAATEEKVTLLTRTFGRGTDFICRNQQLLANGGIHVLQTFFSEELSEEYQIMGRGARQGDKGSYRIILLDKDLEWVLGSNWSEELCKISGNTLYEKLNSARNKLYESKCGAKQLGIEQRKKEHKSSKKFMEDLSNGEIKHIKDFLKQQNKGAALVVDSRTVLLMDATASMSSLLSAAKETVCTMFERASIVLEEKGIIAGTFQMQFAIYRDYDCKEAEILQSSAWETKPSALRTFMQKILPKGGGDYEEAIEIGLWHAVQECEQPEGISQVILIGDAPAKDLTAIERDRNVYGGEDYWKKTKFGQKTHYMLELKKLKDKEGMPIPVHAFYIDKGAADNFKHISSITGGRCEELNINSSAGAECLTDFVTEEILRKTAGEYGEEAVELYRKKFKLTFTS